MQKLFTTILFSFLTICLFAQGSLTGKIIDEETKEGLIGATVTIEGTDQGTVTDFDGNFTIENLKDGAYKLKITYIGYADQIQDVNVEGNTTLATVNMATDAIGLEEVNVIASVAIDRKTPIAVSTIKGSQVEALVGNQEYPEILKSTPSVYVTKSGGGFGDARINVRGFDQRNIAVMINGIPVNDMENGWVYWSNWAGLSDVTSRVQVQRGLGASKLAVASVGGSINIITNAAEMSQGGAVSVGVGNDGYLKTGLMLSTGMLENGWAVSAQGTYTRGDGYIDGTAFRASSYFLSLSKRINDKHSFSLTGLGAPQWHHQRTVSRFDNITIGTYREKGAKFNQVWGEKDGEEFSWRKNFYHKPKVFLNHYWNISNSTNLKTSAYVSAGRGGGTGPRGRINDSNGDRIFDSYSGDGEGIHDENGQVRWDDIVAFNQGQSFEEWGTKDTNSGDDPFAGQYTTTSSGNGFIRRASMNEHNWYGVLSTLTQELSPSLNLIAGVDLRYYRGLHYRRVDNLLGNDAYKSRRDVNNPDNYITSEGRADGNILNYNNDGLVRWGGVFGQLEYSQDKLTAFLSLSGSNQGFKRIDYFNYYDEETRTAISDTITTISSADWLAENPSQESEWENFLGGTVKAGVNYNINDNHNVFLNGGFFSRQPVFDNVFINFVNEVNEDVQNQTIYALEAGYGFRNKQLRLNLNGYYTNWGNRQFDIGVDLQQPDGTVTEGRALFNNVAQVHTGVELEATYKPISQLSLSAMTSIGNWVYASDFTANIQDIDNNVSAGQLTIYGDGLKVGDAAQTTVSFGANYEPIRGLNLYARYFMYDNLYAHFDIDDPVFQSEGGEVLELPTYSLLDAGLSYGFKLGGLDLTARFNMNNVLDEVYVAELFTNNAVLDDNRGFFGFGRTWNAGLKVRF